MIRGQKSLVEPRKSNVIPIKAKLHNRFDFEVIDSKTGKVKQKAYAENIILDKWWTRLFTPATANGWIHVGTGTGTLDPARTTLFNFLSAKVSTESVTTINETDNWVSHKRVAQWLETENQNTAWTEVGIAYEVSSSYLTTHALIKDLNGNPVALNKGTTDIINVYSTVYAYFPAESSGVKFLLPRRETAFSNTLLKWILGMNGAFPLSKSYTLIGDLNTQCPGHSSNGTHFVAAYDRGGTAAGRSGSAATKKLTATITRLPAASFNGIQGIKSILFSASSDVAELQLTLPAPWFLYSTLTGENVGTGDGATLDFETYFPFVKNDGSFILKKNGTVVDSADYTVDYGEPNGPDLLYYLKILDYYRSGDSLGGQMPVPSTAEEMALQYTIFENPFYEKYGISTLGTSFLSVWVSNDSPEGPWTSISGGAIAAQYQRYRYWKVQPTSTYWSNYGYVYSALSNDLAAAKNIHFVAGKAPASGDVITADYRCEVIAKTANNVFDLTVEITLQEKVV